VFDQSVWNKIPKLQAGGHSLAAVEDLIMDIFEPADFSEVKLRMEKCAKKNAFIRDMLACIETNSPLAVETTF